MDIVKNKDLIVFEKNILKKWTKNFLNYIQVNNFIVFKDDFGFKELFKTDLEAIKSFSKKWILESISFFNNDIFKSYLDKNGGNDDEFDYNILAKFQLTGFKKHLNNEWINLFFIFKNDDKNEDTWKKIEIKFEIFDYIKKYFVDNFNQQLQLQFLEISEMPFRNSAYNIQEWIKTRFDFFWKIKNWIIAFNLITDKIIEKINKEFGSKLTVSRNVLFFSWKHLDMKDNGRLIFIYQRFDIRVTVNFRFNDFHKTIYFSVLGVANEKEKMHQIYNIDIAQTNEYDYIYIISRAFFANLKIVDRYFKIIIFLNKISKKIARIWDAYFLDKKMNARIFKYTYKFDWKDLQNLNFDEDGKIYIDVIFKTVQSNDFLRKFKISWKNSR